MSVQTKWAKIMEAKLKNLKSLKQLEASDRSVAEVMAILRSLYSRKMDNFAVDELLNIGGELLAHYSYLAVLASNKRATRDSIEQANEELSAELSLEEKNDLVGITEARMKAKVSMSEFTTKLVEAEQEKNAYEALTNAVEKTISFLQSAIKIKTSEQINTNRNLT